MTLYGKAYFLSSNTRMKMLLEPLYSISAIFNNAAEECSTGIDVLAKILAIMTASLNVQFPD